MNDDRMDDLVAEAAREYNAPPRVPREEMWTRIQAERGARRREQSARRVWIWPSVGAVAAALLIVGVALGRRMERSAGPTIGMPTAVKPTPTDSSDKLIQALRAETANTDRNVRDLAARRAESASAAARNAAGASSLDESTALSYQLVVLKHLAGSEAMITAFRSEARRGEIDAQVADWSKELLSTTRMLEASAVSDDPVMRRLLEDLELVLAQIKQYVTRGTNNPDDLDLIEQSIIKRGVITKLRSAVPARNVPAGT